MPTEITRWFEVDEFKWEDRQLIEAGEWKSPRFLELERRSRWVWHPVLSKDVNIYTSRQRFLNSGECQRDFFDALKKLSINAGELENEYPVRHIRLSSSDSSLENDYIYEQIRYFAMRELGRPATERYSCSDNEETLVYVYYGQDLAQKWVSAYQKLAELAHDAMRNLEMAGIVPFEAPTPRLSEIEDNGYWARRLIEMVYELARMPATGIRPLRRSTYRDWNPDEDSIPTEELTLGLFISISRSLNVIARETQDAIDNPKADKPTGFLPVWHREVNHVSTPTIELEQAAPLPALNASDIVPPSSEDVIDSPKSKSRRQRKPRNPERDARILIAYERGDEFQQIIKEYGAGEIVTRSGITEAAERHANRTRPGEWEAIKAKRKENQRTRKRGEKS